jgi:methanogenic corrinoid protein MtbC1
MSYSIDQFSKITGINKLLLRTWENRYNFLAAERTESKIRSYSDELLIKALNAKLLVDNGHKISVISKKNDSEIELLLSELVFKKNKSSFNEYCVNNFIKSALKFDTDTFNKTYSEASKKYTTIEFYKNIMLPTFSKIGLFWLTNKMNPAQEHFLSEMFKQKMYKQIDEESTYKNKKSKTWLLFLPPNEHHEMGLLFTRYLLTNYGYNVVYLGSNVPLPALNEIAKCTKIDFTLFFVISNFSKLNITKTTEAVNKYFSNCKNFVVANQTLDEKTMKKFKMNTIDSVDSFIKML